MLAPIALFVYNRPWHTKHTVESLSRNILASKSELFIFSDGSKNKLDDKNVYLTREYIYSIKGFKSVIINERSENLGLSKSIISGVTEIINQYGKIIVLEDDLVTSPFFLEYMNDALEYYEYENRVISIHGYCYPLKINLPETYFLMDTGSWGWATWKRGWEIFEPDGSKLLQEIETKNLARCFNINNSYPFTNMLMNQIKGKNNSWAIRWQASAFLRNKLTLFPGQSLVANIGFDNSGTHSASTSRYNVNLTLHKIKVSEIPIDEDKIVRKQLEYFFLCSKRNKIKFILRRINDYFPILNQSTKTLFNKKYV
ncbi:MAG: hypothetical protein WC879_06135 [Melioribacteraceae bacterium]